MCRRISVLMFATNHGKARAQPAAAFVGYKNRAAALLAPSLLPSFSQNPTTPCSRRFVLNAPRIRPFCLALLLHRAHQICYAAAKIHASSRIPRSSLPISILQTLCNADHLFRSASHLPRYKLSHYPLTQRDPPQLGRP